MATARVRATVKAAAAPFSAFDLCGCIQRALLATRRRHGVQGQEQLCRRRRALHARAGDRQRDAADHLLREGAQSAREFVTEFSGGATPHREAVSALS